MGAAGVDAEVDEEGAGGIDGEPPDAGVDDPVAAPLLLVGAADVGAGPAAGPTVGWAAVEAPSAGSADRVGAEQPATMIKTIIVPTAARATAGVAVAVAITVLIVVEIIVRPVRIRCCRGIVVLACLRRRTAARPGVRTIMACGRPSVVRRRRQAAKKSPRTRGARARWRRTGQAVAPAESTSVFSAVWSAEDDPASGSMSVAVGQTSGPAASAACSRQTCSARTIAPARSR